MRAGDDATENSRSHWHCSWCKPLRAESLPVETQPQHGDSAIDTGNLPARNAGHGFIGRNDGNADVLAFLG